MKTIVRVDGRFGEDAATGLRLLAHRAARSAAEHRGTRRLLAIATTTEQCVRVGYEQCRAERGDELEQHLTVEVHGVHRMAPPTGWGHRA